MNNEKITLSVVMTVHDEATLLDQNLPLFLTQSCDTDYEVIVVDDASADETPDVLKRMKSRFPQLYTTFIPHSVPNPCRKRLALTIGAKAAKNDWVVLADIKRPPSNENTYQALMSQAAEQQEGVLTLYGRKKNGGETKCQCWQELNEASPLLTKAERRSGQGHNGRGMKLWRGLYDAVAVRRREIHDVLKFYDQKVTGTHLLPLRMKVMWRTMRNSAIVLNK